MSNCTKAGTNRLMMTGMLALALAQVGQWYLQRHSGFNEDLADFGSGMLQGIAIATMLIALWLRGRSLPK